MASNTRVSSSSSHSEGVVGASQVSTRHIVSWLATAAHELGCACRAAGAATGNSRSSAAVLEAEQHRLQVLANPREQLLRCTRPVEGVLSSVLALGVAAVKSIAGAARNERDREDANEDSGERLPSPPEVEGLLTAAAVNQRVAWLLRVLPNVLATAPFDRTPAGDAGSGSSGSEAADELEAADDVTLADAERQRLLGRTRGNNMRASALEAEAQSLRKQLQLLERQRQQQRQQRPQQRKREEALDASLPVHSPDQERVQSPDLPRSTERPAKNVLAQGGPGQLARTADFLDVGRAASRLRRQAHSLREGCAHIRRDWLASMAEFSKSIADASRVTQSLGCAALGEDEVGDCASLTIAGSAVGSALRRAASANSKVERRLTAELKRRLEGIAMTLEDRASRARAISRYYRRSRLALRTQQQRDVDTLEAAYRANVARVVREEDVAAAQEKAELQPRHEGHLARLRRDHRRTIDALQDAHAESKTAAKDEEQKLRERLLALRKSVIVQTAQNEAIIVKTFRLHADFLERRRELMQLAEAQRRQRQENLKTQLAHAKTESSRLSAELEAAIRLKEQLEYDLRQAHAEEEETRQRWDARRKRIDEEMLQRRQEELRKQQTLDRMRRMKEQQRHQQQQPQQQQQSKPPSQANIEVSGGKLKEATDESAAAAARERLRARRRSGLSPRPERQVYRPKNAEIDSDQFHQQRAAASQNQFQRRSSGSIAAPTPAGKGRPKSAAPRLFGLRYFNDPRFRDTAETTFTLDPDAAVAKSPATHAPLEAEFALETSAAKANAEANADAECVSSRRHKPQRQRPSTAGAPSPSRVSQREQSQRIPKRSGHRSQRSSQGPHQPLHRTGLD